MTALTGDLDLPALAVQVRAATSKVWEPAVRSLVARSAADPAAFEMLRQLLLSEEAELRYRGVVGLKEAAQLQPDSLVGFLRDRWEESSTRQDPVLLHGLAQACQGLPESLLDTVTSQLWDAEDESLRCSAIPLLWRRLSRLGAAAVEPAICDSCTQVRATVALELTERLPISVAFEGLARLVHDPQVEVRSAVALGLLACATGPRRDLASPEFRYLWMTLESDDELLVRSLLENEVTPWDSDPGVASEENQAFALMAELEQRPEVSLKKLSPWLRMAGSWHRLKTVAEFSHHPEVAQVAQALAVLCDEQLPARERLLRCLAILQSVTDRSTLGELRLMTRYCLRLVEAEELSEALVWAAEFQTSGPDGVGTTLHWSELNKLSRILQRVENSPTLPTLSWALLETRALRILSSSGPLPERELIEPALLRMEALVERQLSMLTGEAYPTHG